MDNNNPNNPNQPPAPFPADPAGTPPADPSAGATLPDPMSIAGTPPPAEPSAWPPLSDQANAQSGPGMPPSAETPTPGSDPGQPATPPQAPASPTQPFDTNPFLQQPAASPGMPEAPAAPVAPPPIAPTDPSQLGAAPPAQDPLNTAFAPVANPNQPNPFEAPAASGIPEAPAAPVAPPPTPGAEQTAQPPSQGLPDFMNPNASAEPSNPIAEMAAGTNQMQSSDETASQAMSSETSFGQSGTPGNASGTIDLSAIQTETPPANPEEPGTPAPEAPAAPPPAGAPLPETGPVENAPTDLSHLIAGEGEHQAPSDIYTPPVAQDQNPSVSQPQTPTQPGTDGAPPEKHLNLTKVLLVAGIPILLIVAALSAYLIMGIGKPAAEPSPTPLPLEQTQAPLTNPPQQIADPSPATLPNPSTSAVFEAPPATASALPTGSASPLSALEQLRARSASPSPAASASPAPSPSTTN